MTSIVLGPLSSPFLTSVSVLVMLCLHLYCLSSTVLVCLCFFVLRVLHVMHCWEFGQLSFFLHVLTIGVFAVRLCLTKLFLLQSNYLQIRSMMLILHFLYCLSLLVFCVFSG